MRLQGPWQSGEIEAFLRQTVIPIRVAVLHSDGWPRVASLWFDFEAGAIWCATAEQSLVARLLARNERCGFEVAGDAPPYRGVRGRASATLVPERGDEVLERLARRYLGEKPSAFKSWLLQRGEPEVALRIEPFAVSSWDYSARMGR